jgi:hypothetical protein
MSSDGMIITGLIFFVCHGFVVFLWNSNPPVAGRAIDVMIRASLAGAIIRLFLVFVFQI